MKHRKYQITNVNQLKTKLLPERDNITNNITRKLAQFISHRLFDTKVVRQNINLLYFVIEIC